MMVIIYIYIYIYIYQIISYAYLANREIWFYFNASHYFWLEASPHIAATATFCLPLIAKRCPENEVVFGCYAFPQFLAQKRDMKLLAVNFFILLRDWKIALMETFAKFLGKCHWQGLGKLEITCLDMI